jgi:hypothetical protein
MSPMKLFLSYPSSQRLLAERLTLALEAEGHEVFVDRADLKAGEAFHQRLREAIFGADGMVFLVTPESIAPGSYALAELNIARQRWRRPGGHVLPVIVQPTPYAELPPYLTAVTVLEPGGDVVAEIVAAVTHLQAPRPRRRWLAAGLVGLALLAAVAAGVVIVQRQDEQRAAAQAVLDAQRRMLAQAASARELCDAGGYAVAMLQLRELAARKQAPPKVLDAYEDCAMRWLRDMRATVGKQTFAEQVAQAQPPLLNGLSRAKGERAADLRSHIGWGEYLRGRDGAAVGDPVVYWKRALVDDPDNVYANAMWARRMSDRPGQADAAQALFAKAVASGRNRAFVRGLQFGSALGGSGASTAYAVQVADEMRRAGETVRPDHRDRLWSHAFGPPMLDAQWRSTLFAALAPGALWATFVWLYPEPEVAADRRPLWRFTQATLQAHNGDRAAARAGLESLVKELQAGERSGRLLDEAQRGLAGLPAAAPAARAKAASRPLAP